MFKLQFIRILYQIEPHYQLQQMTEQSNKYKEFMFKVINKQLIVIYGKIMRLYSNLHIYQPTQLKLNL